MFCSRSLALPCHLYSGAVTRIWVALRETAEQDLPPFPTKIQAPSRVFASKPHRASNTYRKKIPSLTTLVASAAPTTSKPTPQVLTTLGELGPHNPEKAPLDPAIVKDAYIYRLRPKYPSCVLLKCF